MGATPELKPWLRPCDSYHIFISMLLVHHCLLRLLQSFTNSPYISRSYGYTHKTYSQVAKLWRVSNLKSLLAIPSYVSFMLFIFCPVDTPSLPYLLLCSHVLSTSPHPCMLPIIPSPFFLLNSPNASCIIHILCQTKHR